MIDPKEHKKLKGKGFSDDLLKEVNNFLENHEAELFNLAFCDSKTYRIMYRDKKTKVVSAQLFPFIK